MDYYYYAKEDYYSYLSSGVQAWDLLLPNDIGLSKGDNVIVIEVDSNDNETGRVTTGVIRFNGVDGVQTFSNNKDLFYIVNLISSNMYTSIRATISQSGTNPPTINILQNTTGLTPSLSYDDVGNYGIDNLGIIDAYKVILLIGTTDDARTSINAVAMEGGHEVFIASTGISGSLENDILNNCAFDIKIYS